jgi:hypothetical protein
MSYTKEDVSYDTAVLWTLLEQEGVESDICLAWTDYAGETLLDPKVSHTRDTNSHDDPNVYGPYRYVA